MSTQTNSAKAFSPRRALHIAVAATSSLLLAAVLAAPAPASQAISEFSVSTTNTEAGAHPDLQTSIRLDSPGQPEAAKDVALDFPEGLFGSPQAITRCSSANFTLNQCPPAAQLGLITIYAHYEGDPNYLLGTAPLYNLEARGEFETARLAFVVPTVNIPINVPVTLRTGSDYGLRMTVSGITQQIPLAAADITVWGFPANPFLDSQRFPKGSPEEPPGCPGLPRASCIPPPHPSAAITLKPFTFNPTVCTGEPLTARLEIRTYQDPANPSRAEASYPPTTDCVKQVFRPVIKFALTTNEADSPAGLDLQLRAPQFVGVTTSPSQLRSARVILPEGISINPDAADGQSACLDAQARLGTEKPAACPDNAKIGTFDIRTPALEGPLTGSLYFGEPKPGNQYRVFMVAHGFGINAKLATSVLPDPRTGQLTMVTQDLPQVPFEEFNLHLFASDRGLVATPTHCSVYQADSVIVPWNDALSPQSSRPHVSVDSGPNGRPCPDQIRPFRPRLVAGMSTPVAGAFSNFHLKLDRDDGDQFLRDLTFKMPPGFTGDLRGIPYCPEAAIAAAALNLGRTEQAIPSCPAPSQIGTTNVAAGPGSKPFHAVGKMYLSGPLKGAPLSLATITPALAGPYDYGTVVVRVALHVDPRTAQVSALSDTVPEIIGGVPIRMRSIRVNIDRERFTINPTNCSPFTVDSQGIGDQGTVTDFSSYFQAVNCAILPFKPRMSIRQLGGKGQTTRSKNPVMRFDLRTRPGDANIKRVAVTLPKAFAIDQRHLGNICAKSQLEAELCKGRQPIGHAWVKTPLLDQPLKGPAYAVSGYGKLPRVAFILAGQVTIIPQAESSSVNKGHLKTVVPVVPDAPIGHFRLTLLGRDKGYLVNTRSLCAAPAVTKVSYTAQSGRRLTQRVRTKTACGKGKRRAKRAAHSRR